MKNKIKLVGKQGFCQPVAKHENEEQANISTRASDLSKRKQVYKQAAFYY
jgi:hypothetical protein